MTEISAKNHNFDTREKCCRVSPRTVVPLWPYEYLCFFLKTAIFEYLGNSLCIFHYVVQNTQRIVKILKNEKNSKFSVSLMIKWHHVIVSDIFLEYRNFDFWQKFLSSGRNFYHLPVGRKLGIFWKFFPFSSRNFWSLQKFLTEISSDLNISRIGPQHPTMLIPTHPYLGFWACLKSEKIGGQKSTFSESAPQNFKNAQKRRRNFGHPQNFRGWKKYVAKSC